MFNLIEEVKDAGTIGIGGHVRPDGDCVGSTVALFLPLIPEALGISARTGEAWLDADLHR